MMKRRLLLLLALLLTIPRLAHGQISGIGQFGCQATPVSGTVWNSGTSLNATQVLLSGVSATAALVQLNQTTTITAGAGTFQISYDGTNWISVPVAQVLNASTGAQLTNPYTFVASTNQPFLIILSGATNLRLLLGTQITGSGSVTPFTTPLCGPTTAPPALDTAGLLNTDLQRIAGTAVDVNSGNKSAGTQRFVLATDQPNLTTPLNVALAANQSVNTAQISGTTTSVNSGTTDAGTQRVTISSDSTGQIIPAPTTASADAVSACNILSAASTNSTSCKGSAGNFYGYEVFNNTTTIYYLRLYNSSAAPTCSSATGFIRTIPIPPAGAAGQAGGAISNQVFPVNYTTGIGYCITGGSTSTDNTNAAAGVFGEIRYK